MKASIRQKLEKTAERFEEVGRMLADPAIAGGSDTFRELSMEYARLEPVAAGFREHVELESQLNAARELSDDADPEMREMGQEESRRLAALMEQQDVALSLLLLPKDPRDERNIYRRCAPVRGETRRQSLPATCTACTHATRKDAAGRWKSSPRAMANMAATRK
jgi:protein subunit release factor A